MPTVTETNDQLGYELLPEIALEEYPSTYDCPLSEGGDPVLACLTRARDRVELGHTRSEYIGANGEVCAMGAIYVADGKCTEFGLSQTAKSAVRELDDAALRLYPQSRVSRLLGPAEWVNQLLYDGQPFAGQRTRRAVLKTYDEAIRHRRELATV